MKYLMYRYNGRWPFSLSKEFRMVPDHTQSVFVMLQPELFGVQECQIKTIFVYLWYTNYRIIFLYMYYILHLIDKD